ncbi:MAG: ribosome biogenesis/translation initiation ATPase RLI [Candidatus Hermodarchaeota archaeon]
MKKITVVMRDKCSPDTCNYRCINLCPVNMTGKKSKPVIVPKAIKLHGTSVFPVINHKHCINCGICGNTCFKRAIKTVNIPGEIEEWNPVHQYKESEFQLFGLPILNQGTVTGVIGENGIGKSTLLNILAGKIQPNGGNFSKKAFNLFLTNLSTPGMARYLETVSSGELTVSLKSQNLTHLKQRGLTPQELFEDMEKEDLKIVEILRLKSLLSKELTVASGGELQRVAIAQTMMKPADVYLLDEPASYLDFSQRLNLARVLKHKLNKKRSILIVEHDISVLDYWSDLIHILWGEPHVYGVVSRALSVKKGLNSFLSGWLKEENIHFRHRVISFKRSVTKRQWKERPYIQWDNDLVTLDGFALDVKSGKIFFGEILVIVGENGLGKTTFANLISGRIPGHPKINAIISYKPQQITKDFDLTVSEFLQKVTGTFLNTKEWKLKLLSPLGINHYLDREMRELSGGETQRVFIAACLAKSADLYILDEPSAFLDALERTKIANVIRNQTKRNPKCAVISIEHDVQLADFTADRIMRFEGIPSQYGVITSPMSKRDGMNAFLKSLNITFRRDPETGRARINKENSQMDKKQKEIGEFYYSLSRI